MGTFDGLPITWIYVILLGLYLTGRGLIWLWWHVLNPTEMED